MKTKLIVYLVSFVGALSLPISVTCSAPSVGELLPPDSLVCVEISDMGVLYYLISEVGGAAVKSLEEETEIPEHIRVKARAVLEAFNEIKPLLPRSASLGVVSINPRNGPSPSVFVSELPEAVAPFWSRVRAKFVSELPEGLAPLVSGAGKLIAFAPNVKVTKTKHGTEVVFPHKPFERRYPSPIGYAVKDNVLYATLGKGLLDKVLSGPPTESLAGTAHFKEVKAVTGENAFLSAYLNLDAMRELMLEAMPSMAPVSIEALGLEGMHALGVSLSADEKQAGFNLALQFTEDAPGIPSILSVPNTAPKGIAYVPADFAYVRRLSVGSPEEFAKRLRALLEKCLEEVDFEQELARLKEEMGIDVDKVLASLGGEVTIGLRIPEEPPVYPGALVCLEARDPGYLVETLKNFLPKMMSVSITETEVDGRKVTRIFQETDMLPVCLAVATDGDMVLIEISMMGKLRGLLEKALAAKESGQNIASKPDFKAAMEGLPAESNVALEYIDLEALGRLAIDALGAHIAEAPEEAKPAIAKGMAYASMAAQNLKPAAAVVYRTPGGLAVKARWETRSLMRFLTNGAALATKAILWSVVRWEPGRPEEMQVEEEPVPWEAEGLDEERVEEEPAGTGRIAFCSNREGNWHIYVMNCDGSGTRRLTDSPAANRSPSWSPDGKKIAFVSHRDGNPEIYVMNADGSEQKRLTHNPAHDGDPSWSPDGKIAFCSRRDRNADIYIMNADGTEQTRLTKNPRWDQNPSWSPDGKKIAFEFTRDGAHSYDIYVVNADGSEQKNLTNHWHFDQTPAWSPDGKKIAFASSRDSKANDIRSEIYVMNADGTEIRRLTNSPAFDMKPSWSPDGNKIVFVSNRDFPSEEMLSEIYVMNADGSEQKRLTDNRAGDDSPSWSPVSDCSAPVVCITH